MGHLGDLKEEYRALVERLDAAPVGLPEPTNVAARKGWQEILEILYTPEEAALASRLPTRPADLKKLSERLGMPPEPLKAKLDAMCDKGIVMDLVSRKGGKTYYFLSPPVVGFFEFSLMRLNDSKIPQKRLAQAMDAYLHGDEAFASQIFGGDTVIGRALVHETALDESSLPEVLDWEKAAAVLKKAKSLAVSHCYCRHKNQHLGKACDAPTENCLSLNAGADFVVRRKFGRAIDKEEALKILDASRSAGLVQIADNVMSRPTYICNCCGCCCGQLRAVNEFGYAAVNPSGFIASCDPNICTGCGRCARACPIAAVGMTASRKNAERKNSLRAVVDAERCLGCGVCADACGKDAMRMARRAKQPKVPANMLERMLRMAMERGKLPDLLLDAGESRGHRFLLGALKILSRLPLADKALASEQMKSRFLAAALSRVKDPTE